MDKFSSLERYQQIHDSTIIGASGVRNLRPAETCRLE